uniref:phospholipase D n=1 Tax=Escherichia coli TaxID=562 RepID=A0A3G4RTV9_ECOLX|nr:phospholipase D family protein [Escherichia coli]
MAYSFTDPDVMHALAKAKKRGVDVRIVVDDKGNTNRASQEAMKYINLLDIPLRTVDAFPIHHDKVIIVDGNTVETGSYTSLVLLHARIQRMSLCSRICRM